jgi:hypothetical protein
VRGSSEDAFASAPSRTRLAGLASTPSFASRSALAMSEMHRTALRSAAVVVIGPTIAPHLQWTASGLPTVRNVESALGDVTRRCCANSPALLRDSLAASALQNARGNWEPVLQRLAAGVAPTIEAMSAAFEAHNLPLASATGTRVKAWRN